MGSQQGLVVLIRLVKDANGAVQGAAHNLETIIGDVDSADWALVLCLHEELLEVKRPYPEIGVLASNDAKGVVDCNGIDCLVIRFIGCLQLLRLVVDLIDDAVLASDEYALQTFILQSISGSEAILEVESGEYSVPCVMVQHDGGPSDVGGVPDSPESNVFLATRGEPGWINGTELELNDVEF